MSTNLQSKASRLPRPATTARDPALVLVPKVQRGRAKVVSPAPMPAAGELALLYQVDRAKWSSTVPGAVHRESGGQGVEAPRPPDHHTT